MTLRRLGYALIAVGALWVLFIFLTQNPVQTPPEGMNSATPTTSTAIVKPSPTPAVVTPSVTPTPTPAIPANPRGNPLWVTVEHPGEQPYVSTSIVPNRLQLNEKLVPPSRKAGWYAEPQWPKPGELSALRSVLVGHATCGSGCHDVFYNLKQVRIGDIVRVKYDSGDVAVFRVYTDWASKDKDEFVIPIREDGTRTDVYPAWFSPTGAEEQVVTLATCDTASGYTAGYSNNNGYTQAVRIG